MYIYKIDGEPFLFAWSGLFNIKRIYVLFQQREFSIEIYSLRVSFETEVVNVGYGPQYKNIVKYNIYCFNSLTNNILFNLYIGLTLCYIPEQENSVFYPPIKCDFSRFKEVDFAMC